VNRATQGVYQPGAAFQTIVLAEALSRGATYLTNTVQADALVQLGSATLDCASPPMTDTVAAAYAVGCPAPFATLADQLDAASLASAIQRWQLDTITDGFELPVHTSAWSPAMLTTAQAVRELALGQGALTVSPLQMATVIGTIANDGHSIGTPHITFAAAPSSQTFSPLSPEIALSLQNTLPAHDDLAGQVALAASGENRLAWFLGFAPARSPQWAIVVLLENGDAAADWQIATSVRTKLAP
jgi:cell division protein FtsI/penicillin-binding protein 2